MKVNFSWMIRALGLCLLVLYGSRGLFGGQKTDGAAQKLVASRSDASRGLEAQMTQLQSAMLRLESQMAEMEKQAGELRSELRDTRARLTALQAAERPTPIVSAASTTLSPPDPSQPGIKGEHSIKSLRDRVSQLEESQQLLQTKVRDQYQMKVESASKYRIVLSGIALLNVFSNRGAVDNLDLPQFAQEPEAFEPNAAFGATVRQSTIGLDVFGPTLAGARTYGEIQADFFGGFPIAPNGATTGIMRIRTATLHMDWDNTSIVAGQGTVFFSPLSPTSYASVAEPAFAYSGNLWGWVPQIRVEQRINLSDGSALTFQGGILDSLTGEPPAYGYYRDAQAGEASGQPAYATRLAWSRPAFGHHLTAGLGGYYSPENWGFGRKIDGWAATADWDLPVTRAFSFSGELYRGKAIGALGGGVGRSVLYNGDLTSPTTSVLGLNSAGGWTQLKFRPFERLQFNGAFGEDESFASDLRHFPVAQSYFNASINRNQTGLVNVIYYPRSDLLLSLEYRRIWTSEIGGSRQRAGQINLGAGFLF
ncbi:MAG: PspA/IM30 family protein [Terriglobia bacterium]